MLGHTRGDTGIYRYNFDEKLLLPVKRHRGEPGHTRDTRNTRTHKGTQYPVPVPVTKRCSWVWMVVRFVCAVRVPLCVRVSRVCPVCVPAPPGVFLPVTKQLPYR